MRRLIPILFLLSVLLWGAASPGNEAISRAYRNSYTLESQGKYRKALEVFQPLEPTLKHQYGYNLRMAWLYSLAGDYKKAVRYYTKASLIKPDSFEPRLGLARVYLPLHKPSLAEINAKIVLEKDPLNYYANLYLARTLLALHQKDAARRIVKRLLTYYPSSPEFLRLSARLTSKPKAAKHPKISPKSR
ncbi:tetratricopeptide repeat protein [Nitratifractor salsuginis]|uniref:Tetratricopeptide repeat protein n=1 Tax=Nitratifractor salsuginis (strain DSM 16511 / JCM 12458 / E9I37-1) TaxID=749222 RepID=E6X064_NITSE|nr:tetratricopeptide repeat protein [Nitratifractor salsuginis]ADV46787.1 Tetratricopeptide repeat protein [Nitratifractor salsuginis DSM 16511]